MKLIDDDATGAAQRRIIEHPPGQNAFGYKANASCCADFAIESDFITNFVANSHTAFKGNPFGCKPRSKPARLQHHNVAITDEVSVEQRTGHPGSLTCTRWRDQYGDTVLGHSVEQRR